MRAVEPTFPGHLRTLEALRRYRLFAKDYPGEPLAVPSKPIAPGGTYADLPRLVQLLRLVGDLPAEAQVSAQSTTYQGALVDAVKAYQFRHGELPDGYIKPKLINEMNVPVSVRVRQIELALDDDNHVALVKTVIIGKAFGHKSPVFEKEIYVVFRPYWEVSPTIQRAEIVPHVEKNRNYIAQKNFEVMTPDGKVVTDGVISDAVLAQLKSGHLRVRQKPGPTNSLGLVKLIFPNEDNVYLHGTEAPQLFGQEVRDLSHGCIRVHKPADLAAWALRHKPGWNLERVQAMTNGTQDNVT